MRVRSIGCFRKNDGQTSILNVQLRRGTRPGPKVLSKFVNHFLGGIVIERKEFSNPKRLVSSAVGKQDWHGTSARVELEGSSFFPECTMSYKLSKLSSYFK